MKKSILLLFLFLTTLNFAQKQYKLWYEKPANEWVEALPLGNGKIGAMVFGGIEKEIIQLNEGSLWSGGPQKHNVNPKAYQYLAPLRTALAAEDYPKVNELCRKMQGNYSESFLPMADLEIKQNFDGKAQKYYRDLNLSEAIANTFFEVDGNVFCREMFTSAPDNVMVIKFSATKENSITLDFNLSSKIAHNTSLESENTLVLSGKAPSRVDPSYYNPKNRQAIIQDDQEGCRGMRFQTVLRLIPQGGEIYADSLGLHVKNANEVLAVLSAATSFNGMFNCPESNGKDEKAISISYINAASSKPYSKLKESHLDDFQKFFNRVDLHLTDTLGNKTNDKLPSDLRLKLFSYGNYDPELEELFYQYGRYLLISSSRPGGTPANLQGIWNPHLRAPWSSNFTININTEMNYWPAEITNLSEMHQPLLDFVKDLSESGKVTAKQFYNARGWVAHHNTDIWGLSNPVGDNGNGSPTWANWYMGGNWLAQHLWEHYEFTGDLEFLKTKAYPVMKEAALFSLDWLVNKEGYLITSPSSSPEMEFKFKGKSYAVTEGSTMDLAIIRNLFQNVISATEVLKIDTKFRKEVSLALSRILPYQVGSRGHLQEWMRDYEDKEPHHRHISHLFALHPGRDISPITTPELAKAANKTFELRGDEGTGWSKGWKINFAARLLDGDHAYKMIRDIMRYVDPKAGGSGGTYPNFFDAHPPFQIDGNFAATAGMTEMLVQSHLGEVHLLPALPNSWPSGYINGLKARGNFQVDICWEKHKLQTAKIVSILGNDLKIRSSQAFEIKDSKLKSLAEGNYFVLTVKTKPGQLIQISAL